MQLCSKHRGALVIEPETFLRRGQLSSCPPTTGLVNCCHMHEPGTDARIWTCAAWWAARIGAAHICNIVWCICSSDTTCPCRSRDVDTYRAQLAHRYNHDGDCVHHYVVWAIASGRDAPFGIWRHGCRLGVWPLPRPRLPLVSRVWTRLQGSGEQGSPVAPR